MKTYAALAFAVLLLAGCRREAAAPGASRGAVYGRAVAAETALPIAAVAADVEMYLGQPVTVEGTVREVCQEAGCWFTLDAGGGKLVRVTVPTDADGEYVFTVPKNVSGRRAVVSGTLKSASMSAEEAQHMAEDAGHELHEEHAAQAADEVRLEATGVLLQEI